MRCLWGMFVVLPLLTFVVGCDVAVPASTAPSSDGMGLLVADVSGTTFDFSADGKARAKVSLRNAGGGSLHISGAQTGCGCTEVMLPQRNLKEGDKAILQLLIDPMRAPMSSLRMDLDKGSAHVLFRCTLTGGFRVDGKPGGEFVLELSDDLELPFCIREGSLSLGEIPEAGGVTSRKLELQLKPGYTRVVASSRTPGIEIVESDVTVQPDLSLEIQVSPQSLPQSVSRGDATASVVIRATSIDGRTIPVVMPLTLKIIPPITYSPSRIVAGPLYAGESQEVLIMFRPDQCRFTDIGSVELVSSEDEITLTEIFPATPGMGARVRVNATSPGLHKFSACFRVFDKQSTVKTEIQVPVIVLTK